MEMTKASHDRIHSLVPVYSIVKKINDMSKDGLVSGNAFNYYDIRDLSSEALSELMKLEQQLVSTDKKRRSYERVLSR